jgi:hypothetical protein
MMIINLLGRISDDVYKNNTDLLSFYKLENVLYLFAGHSDYDIPLDTKFIRLYKEDSPLELFSMDAQLIDVVHFNQHLDFIPMGWRTIIGLKFISEIPYILNEMPKVDNYDSWDYRICIEAPQADLGL